MFWKIFLCVLAGIAILHLSRIRKLDEKNPGQSIGYTLKVYLRTNIWFLVTTVIGLIVLSNILNIGLAPVIAKAFLGFGGFIDAEKPWGIFLVSFAVGLTMEWVIQWLSKRKTDSAERVLEKLKEIKTNNIDAAINQVKRDNQP
jgi:hypothetical protein